MYKTHYFPFGLEESESAPCGTFIPDDGYTSAYWTRVTCKRCWKSKDRISASIDADEQSILASMDEWNRMCDSLLEVVKVDEDCEVI